MKQAVFQVGSVGWEAPNWQEAFYPEEMPEDWRLDFYANFFRTVLVPPEQWQAWSQEACEEILESVELETDQFTCEAFAECPPFQFFLWLEVSELTEAIFEQVAFLKLQLGDYLAGVVWYTATPPASAERLQRLRERLPVHVMSTFRADGIYFDEAGFDFAMMPDGLVTPKAQRIWAEELLARIQSAPPKQEDVPLCVWPIFVGQTEGAPQTPASPETVKSLKLIMEFLT